MARTGLAARARQAMKGVGEKGREFTIVDVADRLDLISDSDKRPLYRAFCDFARSGEIERVKTGVYRYRGPGGGRKKPETRQVMWRLLRSRRVVTVADLQELSGAKEAYVLEWLQLMERNEIVKKIGPRKYQLICDPVVMPDDGEKAARLRRIRQEKKQALERLTRVATEAAGVCDDLKRLFDSEEA